MMNVDNLLGGRLQWLIYLDGGDYNWSWKGWIDIFYLWKDEMAVIIKLNINVFDKWLYLSKNLAFILAIFSTN